MRVLLLVAGRSTRFWPLAEKSLHVVAGRRILDHQLERLRDAELTDITLVGGAHNKSVMASLYPDLPFIIQEDLDLGMQGALVSALPSFGEESVLVVGSNDIVDTSAFLEVKRKAEEGKADGALLAKRMERYFPGGYVQHENGRIRSIVEKPGEGKEPSDLVTIVVHYHRNAAVILRELLALKPGTHDDGYERALGSLFGAQRYEIIPYEGAWHPVKYPWHLLPLSLRLLGEMEKPSIASPELVHPTAVLQGPVYLAKDVKVLPHATIVGPCVIGEGSVIANNALVRQSSIGARCVVGFATEVVRSVLGDDVWTHSSYVGDSVLGDNVSLGAGTTTANLRLDEGEIGSTVKGETVPTGLAKFGTIIGKDCRIGVRTILSPGTKVGTGSMLASGVSVTGDIPDGSFVVMKNGEAEVRPNTKEVPKSQERSTFRKAAGL